MIRKPTIAGVCYNCDKPIISKEPYFMLEKFRDMVELLPTCETCFQTAFRLPREMTSFNNGSRSYFGILGKEDTMDKVDKCHVFIAVVAEDIGESALEPMRKAKKMNKPMFLIHKKGLEMPDEMKNMPWVNTHFYWDTTSLKIAIGIVKLETRLL